MTESTDEHVVNGQCSLREALYAVNGTAEPDCGPGGSGTTITFKSGVTTVNIDTINQGGSIPIDFSVTIDGGSGVTIDGGSVANSNTVFTINNNDTPFTNVLMQNLTIQHNFSGGGAGIIDNIGSTVTLTNVTVKNNSASSNGGAIINENSATLTVLNSAFNGNTSGADGGAIWNGGNDQLTITTTNFASNTANGNGGAIYNAGTIKTILVGTLFSNFSTNTANGSAANQGGGAIYDDANGTLTMAAVSFNTNTAFNGEGGAVFVNLNAGAIAIDDSAFVANVGQSGGGALFVRSAASFLRDTFTLNVAPNQANGIGVNGPSGAGNAVTIANSTITQNQNSDSSVATILNQGPGDVVLYNDTIHNNVLEGLVNTSTGSIQVGNTILDGNGASNCAGTITSLGHNIDDANSCGFAGAGDQINTNPNLGGNPLGTYYPFQVAFLPNPGSPAIDKGDNTICANAFVQDVDQRAAAAFPTFTRPINVICDIGSIEAPFTATATPTSTPTSTGTVTNTPTNTATNTQTNTGTATNTPTNTQTNTGTATNTSTSTATNTPTNTGTLTNTPTATVTNTGTLTSSPTNTATNTPTNTGTLTNTSTATVTNTGTLTSTSTNTVTSTATNTGTLTNTSTATVTNTGTLTTTPTRTGSPAATVTGTLSVTPVPSNAPSSPTPSILLADPVIAKSVNVQLLRPGDTATFTLTVTNAGTAPASSVVVTDPLPALLQIVSTTESQGTVSISGNTVTFTIGTVNPGQVITLTIVARANPSATPPADIVNIATLSYNGGSPRSSSATIRLTAGGLPGTGEHPDTPQPVWPALLAAVIALCVLGAYRFAQRSVKH